MRKTEAYKAGYDCGLNGANEINCNYQHFRLPAGTKDWEAGQLAGINKKIITLQLEIKNERKIIKTLKGDMFLIYGHVRKVQEMELEIGRLKERLNN